jgi:hypothetical protein
LILPVFAKRIWNIDFTAAGCALPTEYFMCHFKTTFTSQNSSSKDACIDELIDARLRRSAIHIHALGQKPLYGFLRELLLGGDPQSLIDHYLLLDPGFVREIGANRFPRVRTDGGCRS